ncbi:unnamed protein product [Rhizophagus irregularis]|nr:unnamed protein product [Rhizophagus irregularis]
MDTSIIINDEEVTTWVNNDKKIYMKQFFEEFYDIYDVFLAEIVKCKKIEEYTELEKSIILSVGSVSNPGKIPIRLNKPEMKVPAVYYFLSLFLIKYAGRIFETIVEILLRREKTTAATLERMRIENSEYDKIIVDLEKKLADRAEGDLTNGLVILDLENRIRNLEAEVIAKERIILEKSEANNILWEKIKPLEEKEENLTIQVSKMEIDNEKQKKKKRPNKKRKRARVQQINDIGQGLWIKKDGDYINENGDLQELNRRSDYKRVTSRSNSFRMEWEQQSGSSTRSAPPRRHNQWR